MPHSPEITALLHRFVEDRDGLSEQEYAQLTEVVKSSPELAVQLRDQLMIDEALSQRLAIDRRQFDAQVQQRIADHLRGEDELNQQADELRSLALARLDRAAAEPASWSTLLAWGSALILLLAIGTAVWSWRNSQQAALLAEVTEVQGQVVIHRFPKNNDEYARTGLSLQQGDQLNVADDARIALTWPDGTRVQLGGGTKIGLPETTAGKRVAIVLGNAAANVASQPPGRPMIFETPHAQAIVRGTELYLHVQDDDTRLHVVEGKVELLELQTRDVQLVAGSQSATASSGSKVVLDAIRWPTSQQGLVYLFAASQRPVLARSGSLLRPTHLTPRDEGAAFNAQRELELSGGWFEDAAAEEVAARIQAAGAMSLEIVFAPDPAQDDQTQTIFAFHDNGAAVWSLCQSGQRLLLQTTGNEPLEMGLLPELGKLSHLAITCDRGHIAASLDGQKLTEATFAPALPVKASRLVVGGRDADSRWHGRIAGLAIYDRRLDHEEIGRNVAGLDEN